jgi:tRNA threonylcarbamoyladenosine biosynthesis protein TsaE
MTVSIGTTDMVPAVVADLLQHVLNAATSSAAICTLSGDLGAGKTTCIQELARQLGVTETVTSPTFVVMKHYPLAHTHFDMLVHIDAYRIEDFAELEPLRFKDLCGQSRTLICIEWPEKISAALPIPRHTLTIEVVDEVTRRFSYVYQES